MDMELVFSGNPVDLCDGIILFQEMYYLGQSVRPCFDFEIAGYGIAYFLRVYDCSIFFDNAPLFQRLDPHLYCYAGDADLLSDIRVGRTGVFNKQMNDFLIQTSPRSSKFLKMP